MGSNVIEFVISPRYQIHNIAAFTSPACSPLTITILQYLFRIWKNLRNHRNVNSIVKLKFFNRIVGCRIFKWNPKLYCVRVSINNFLVLINI